MPEKIRSEFSQRKKKLKKKKREVKTKKKNRQIIRNSIRDLIDN